jgi:hypothetical protein
VGPFDLGDRTFDGDVIDLPVVITMLSLVLKSVLEPQVIVRIVSWVGKMSVCCGGSWI